MAHVYVHKAHPVGEQHVQPRTLHVEQEMPADIQMPQAETLFASDASRLEDALYHSLPGGTYDRLLGAMLERKASHFIVSHGQLHT